MKYRVKIVGTFDTAAHRDTALNQFQTWAKAKPTYDLQGAVEDEDAQPRLMMMARYDLKGNAESVEGKIKGQLASILGLVRAVISYHHCAHDQPSVDWYDCKTDPRAAYREMIFS